MKYCKFCGSELPDNSKYCPNCGGRVEEDEYQESVENNINRSTNLKLPKNVLGIIGFCLACLSVIVPLAYWYIPVGALVVSIIGYVNREGKDNQGLTKAAFIISIVIFAIKIISLLAIIFIFGSLAEYEL